MITDWNDCFKYWPYKDYLGHWRMPNYTQRKWMTDRWVYREREPTEAEKLMDMWGI